MNSSGGDQLQGRPNEEGYIFQANNEMTQNPQPSEYFNGAPAPFPYNTILSSQPSQESPMNQQVPSSGNQSLFLFSDTETMFEDAMEIIEADERKDNNKKCNVQQSNGSEINIFNHNAIAEQPRPYTYTEYYGNELVSTESESLINHAMNAEIETFQNCSNGANQVNPRTPTPECMTEIWNEYEREEAWKKQKLNESEFLCNTSGFAVTPSQAAVPHSDVIHNHETGVNNNMQHGGYGLRQNFENPQNLIASIQISSTNRIHHFSGEQLHQNSTINSVNNFNNDMIHGRIHGNEANHIQNLNSNLNLEGYRNPEGNKRTKNAPIQKKKNQIQSPEIQKNNETSSSSSKSTAPQKTRGAPKRFTDEENRIQHNNSVKECEERRKARIAQNYADVVPLGNAHQNLLRDLRLTLEECAHILSETQYELVRRQLQADFPYLKRK